MDFLQPCNQFNNPSRNNRVLRVQDATIEEITVNNRTGYVTISYGIKGDFNMIQIEVITLLVSRNTVIRDQSGRNMQFGSLREGMLINAEFSSAMTRSIPPQTNAYRITVINRSSTSDVTVGPVIRVDVENNFFLTGIPNNPLSQTRFVITDQTIILDRNDNKISLSDLKPGQLVRVEHATFMTASIPPQTTAFQVWVL